MYQGLSRTLSLKAAWAIAPVLRREMRDKSSVPRAVMVGDAGVGPMFSWSRLLSAWKQTVSLTHSELA